MNRYHKFIFQLVLLTGCTLFSAGSVEFFDTDKIVSIRLEAPISSLKKQKEDDPDWLTGKVIVKSSEGLETTFNVQLKARGNFRRQKSTCHFPPYWLNFKKSEVKGSLFKGLDKVKVVSHCRDSSSYEPFIHTEYLAYKTYNILTDRSFHVRLANIHYYDTDRNKDLDSFDAFFIEHVDSIEERLNTVQIKDQFLTPSQYNLGDLCRAEMFQFFLGNTDFSYFISQDECCHNAKSFSLNGDNTGLVPIPYDFDMSGLVKPPYARPSANVKIFSVRERLYRGVGVPKEILEQTITHYIENKPEIYNLWEQADFLDAKYQASALEYIDEFYEILADSKKVEEKIIKKRRHIESMDKVIQDRIDEAQRKK